MRRKVQLVMNLENVERNPKSQNRWNGRRAISCRAPNKRGTHHTHIIFSRKSNTVTFLQCTDQNSSPLRSSFSHSRKIGCHREWVGYLALQDCGCPTPGLVVVESINNLRWWRRQLHPRIPLNGVKSDFSSWKSVDGSKIWPFFSQKWSIVVDVGSTKFHRTQR